MGTFFVTSRMRLTALLLCLVWLATAVGASAQPASPGVGAASSGLQVAVTPAVVPDHGSFTLTVRNADGSAYTGLLDYDALICPTNSIKSSDCRVSQADEPWSNTEVVSGTVTVSVDNADGSPRLSNGMYIVRYRPRNSSGQYSNQIAYVVDRAARPVSEATMNNSGQYRVPQPVAGAYVVYRDVTDSGTLNGYTRVEIEQSACGGNGLMQRFTKTSAGAYWSPGDPQSTNIATLRWCIGPSETSPTNFRATEILGYSFNKSSTSATSLRNVRYNDDAFGNLGRLGTLPSTQAEADLEWLLNGGGPQGRLHLQQQLARRNGLRPAASTDPASLFYTLVPTNLFPPLLTSDWTPIVDRIISYDAVNKVFDTWHVEVRASQLGGLYEIRYVEWALYIENLSAQSSRASTPSQSVSDWNLFYRWNVLEDWDWNADGTQNRITQQGTNRAVRSNLGELPGDLPVDCWAVTNGCDTPVKHRLDKLLRYQPTTQALMVSFVDNFGSDVPVLNGRANQPLQLHVRTADGQPYDGFLQLATGAGGRAVWTDANNYPIYVHNGLVEVLPSAFGSAGSTVLSFKVRQQTLNESIAADKALTNVSQPTNEAQPFSNEIYFVQTFS